MDEIFLVGIQKILQEVDDDNKNYATESDLRLVLIILLIILHVLNILCES